MPRLSARLVYPLALLIGGVAVTLAPSLSAAGGFGLGADAPARIPVPASLYSATVEDASGTQVEVRRVTFNGEIFFYGVLGEATVTIPFDKVTEARVEPSGEPGHVVLFAVLKDGTTARIVVEDDLPCYGEATFGNYRVDVGKLRRILLREG